MVYKKARVQARKIILNVKLIPSVFIRNKQNHSSAYSIRKINKSNKKERFNSIKSITINGNTTADPKAIANTIAHDSQEHSSMTSYDPAFLPRKEATEHAVQTLPWGS